MKWIIIYQKFKTLRNLIKTQFYEYLEKFLTELGKSSKKLKKLIETDYKDIRNEECIECELCGKIQVSNDAYLNN